MKYRDYKQFVEGSYYHIYNRGNNKQDIFKEDEDYALFLSRLKENLFSKSPPGRASSNTNISGRKSLPAGAFSLTCYCLMPNHFHLMIKQNTQLPIGVLLSKVCTGYSKYFNSKYERVGQVFQDQFKAIGVDDNKYLVWLSAYIHCNPVVAGLALGLSDWQWSSYGEYFGTETGRLCEAGIIEEQFKSREDYAKFLVESADLIRERKKTEHLLLD